jgi:hypothetical protein
MNSKIILIQQYFIHNNSARLQEINKCLIWNIKNPFIDEIHLLNEKIYNLDILNDPKIKQIDIKERLTYHKAFNYGNNLHQNDIKILSNNDISFHPDSLLYLKNLNLSNVCLALNRYDIINYSPFRIKLTKTKGKQGLSDSQDSWIFKHIHKYTSNNKPPETIYNLVQSSIIKLIDNEETLSEDFKFQLGKPGCDNYVAYLLDKLGMQVINLCSKIITLHHHLSSIRNYSEQDRVGDYTKYKYLKYQ